VILRRGERQYVLPVAHDHETRLLALEEFLDDDAPARIAEAPTAQHIPDGGDGLVHLARHYHALAGGKTVGLDDDGRALPADVFLRRRDVGEAGMAGGGNAMPLHEFLGEVLGGLEGRGGAGGAETAQAFLRETVDEARGKRRVRPDDGEVDALAPREGHER